ncbi:conserved hypothetical protein [Thiocapsa sp. KS1]|nr:WYL domain-containing protein [Thiocapsa sp. KS1]CRI66804.1 conserved hypothetical protein [Thiocapsa sp. KS1]
MTSGPLDKPSQAQRSRLFFLDFRLYFLGSATRSDLVERFGIKEAAATRDLSAYREIAPNNATYDARARKYLINKSFIPIFKHSTHQALSSLTRGIGDDFLGDHRPMIECALPQDLFSPNTDIVAALTRAIHLGNLVEIGYVSTGSGARRRVIAPHALVHSGLKWHVRAFDRRRGTFLDFLLTRMSSVRAAEGSVAEHEVQGADRQWSRFVDLELVAHPNAENVEHPESIELEYGMTDGVRRIEVRAAQAGYFLRLWNVDCSTDHSCRGKEFQLWLRNHQTLYGVDNAMLAPGYRAKEASYARAQEL